MRISGSVISVSWLPSAAVTIMNKGAFESGFTHYDDPPPDHIADLDALRDAAGFRVANHLAASIEVVEGSPMSAAKAAPRSPRPATCTARRSCSSGP